MMCTPIDLLISARWIAPVIPEILLIDHSIAVLGGKIHAILPTVIAKQQFQATEEVDLAEHILIPGLVNLHTHAAMSLMRGMADDLPLMEWLQQHIWPVEAEHVSPEFVYDGTLLACAEMLRGGITTFNDMYFFPDAAAQAIDKAGLRACLGMTILEFPTRYASSAAEYLRKGLLVHEQWQDHSRISFSFAPHAPYTVSDDTFRQIAVLAEQLQCPIHTHLHETASEVADSVRQHQLRPTQRMQQLGIITPNLIATHAVHLDSTEIELFRQNKCHVAHCPSSNLKLASGIAPIAELQNAGVNIGLGTDGAASNNRLDIFSEMRLAALLAKAQSGHASTLSAYQALRMATFNGALALGLENTIGSLEIGKAADICAIDLSATEMQPIFDPIAHLVFVAGREQVNYVWINGKSCLKGKNLVPDVLKDLKNIASLWQNRLGLRYTS